MSGSVNKVILVGHLGADPVAKSFQHGGQVVNLSIATLETWKDKATGDKRERTEWHRVAIFSEGLCGVATRYLRKGSKVYIEGKLQTRKWQDQAGADRYATEIVLQGYDAAIVLLDARRDDAGGGGGARDQGGASRIGLGPGAVDDLDDDVPF